MSVSPCSGPQKRAGHEPAATFASESCKAQARLEARSLSLQGPPPAGYDHVWPITAFRKQFGFSPTRIARQGKEELAPSATP